jgi:hypothetical protein
MSFPVGRSAMLADAIGVRNKRRLSIQDRRLSVLRRRSACSMAGN